MNTEVIFSNREAINCPCCGTSANTPWSNELGFTVVRCMQCRLLYVNPILKPSYIDAAVREGAHSIEGRKLDVRSRRIPRKIHRYQTELKGMFSDLWQSGKAICWVDVGAGYGETLEAVRGLAPLGSSIVGVEPMQYKAEMARKQGLEVQNSYLEPNIFKADVISMVDIFSHIPNFHSFLQIVIKNLKPGGEIFLETGNLADLSLRREFPNELGLPDHLVFAGESQLRRYLIEAGFDVIQIKKQRIDGFLSSFKSIVKKLLGRPVVLGVPYSSHYRQLLIRARLRS
ncbi:class I SAM-dependent methyltransferase [Hydrogenophaga sp.]|uniref:class I SAM-dependent methyltransferase n=1 Tax=Hydrogenophaga sp. TaxID=1904254 RepID=UPI0025C3FE1A|nr:class I SAM-dependent methyltransferase [Hydrogenophaga sp.]MBT9463740.1 class I SAM-dependent methyltransferase [Hydrogenophaga sp.]